MLCNKMALFCVEDITNINLFQIAFFYSLYQFGYFTIACWRIFKSHFP